MLRLILLITLFFSFPAFSNSSKRVVILGFDGFGGYWMRKNKDATPFINSLYKKGVHTTKMRCILPTLSGPNWTGIFRGSRPSVHGVLDNKIRPYRKKWPSTIFEILKNQYPKMSMKVIADWYGIMDILRDNKFLQKENSDHNILDDALNKTLKAINEGHQVIFTHFDSTDHAGHSKGWGSKEYVEAMTYNDNVVKRVYEHLKKNNLLDKVDIIITSDHGGAGNGHSGFIKSNVRDVPFIAVGPSFKENYEIKQVLLRNFQIPHIIAKIFDVKTPRNWSTEGDIKNIYR